MRLSESSHLIAIVGGSGAGKTWLATELGSFLGQGAARLSLDQFYRDRSHLPPAGRERVNYDHPRAIDWPWFEHVLADCRAGRPTRLPEYDFSTHTRSARLRSWQPKAVVLIDGLWLLRRPRVRRQFDLRVFIDCPARVRLVRRLRRDRANRGRESAGVRHRFRCQVAPLHRRFVAPQARWADLVLKHPLTPTGAARLADRLWELVARRGPRPVGARAVFTTELRARLLRPGTVS
ncbi:MAG: uridine kinase [Verrucomicrobia bacterium]|nr:uridine kinase [Verrucomicrobiota bacterium]